MSTHNVGGRWAVSDCGRGRWAGEYRPHVSSGALGCTSKLTQPIFGPFLALDNVREWLSTESRGGEPGAVQVARSATWFVSGGVVVTAGEMKHQVVAEDTEYKHTRHPSLGSRDRQDNGTAPVQKCRRPWFPPAP